MSFEYSISAQRFRPYLIASGFDEARARKLCLWNIQLSEAMYPAIHATEIALRNHVAGAIRAAFGLEWWRAPAFLAALDRGAAKVEDAQSHILRAGKPVDEGSIVSTLSFGFWERMLHDRYHPTIWSGHFRQAFPDVPVGCERPQLKARVQNYVGLRNRVFHHEPIFRRDVMREHSDMLTTLSWISPAVAEWVRPHCRLAMVVRSRP